MIAIVVVVHDIGSISRSNGSYIRYTIMYKVSVLEVVTFWIFLSSFLMILNHSEDLEEET